MGLRRSYLPAPADFGGARIHGYFDASDAIFMPFGTCPASQGFDGDRGMLNLSESAACEWAVSNVRVNTVAPGGIASSGFDTYAPEAKAKILEYPPTVPLQRYGSEAEVSAAIVYLLSPAAAYITGSCIRVDGGTPNARNTWKLAPHARSQPFAGFHRATLPKLLTEGI